jgi:bifunctional oligoribonuclease and PAP phosphatase NrnA
MDPYRKNKKSQSILVVLSDLIQTAVKDPRIGMVTINSVELNRDGSVAIVSFSVLGGDEEKSLTFKGLKKARGFLQSKLTRTLGLRQAPELRFVYDESIVRGIELDQVLDGMAKKGEFLSPQEKQKQLTLEDLQPPRELVRGLREASSLWIVPHHNPDPDTMGAALALAEALREMDRTVRVLGYDDPSIGLSDLPGFADVTAAEDAERIYLEEQPDTLVLVDCHRIDRTGPLEETLDRFGTRWCVDHHLISGRNRPEGGWVEARACSTCTLVYQLIETLAEGDEDFDDEPFDMTLDMATNIYAGVVTDTGGFRFSNTGPFTFDLAARLSRMGVDTAQVSRQSMYRNRPQGMALLQRVLETFEFHAGGRVLIARATQEMLKETGGLLSDTEGFVNIATSVADVRLVAFLKETEPGVWRASLRVRGEGDVQAIAARYGGGGHQQAAGCTIEGEGDDVTALLVSELTAALS